VTENPQQHILDEYDKKVKLYAELTDTVELIIGQIIRDEGIRVHSVTSRPKNRESLRDKK
jgi:hypothetical protein